MGGGCTCSGNIIKYIYGSSDYILNSEQSKKNNKNINYKIPEQNIKIIPKEDIDKSDSNIKNNNKQNSKDTKIQNYKNNSSNKNDETNKKISIENNNNSSDLVSDDADRKIQENNKKDENSYSNNYNTINNSSNNNNIQNMSKKKLLQQTTVKKAITNYNYNLGEHNFIYINISRGSSYMIKDPDKIEPSTPKMTVEKENLDEMAKGNKRIFSHFCKNKLNDRLSKIQSNTNNITVKHHQSITPYLNNYSEDMIKEINLLRKDPQSFIEYIDSITKDNILKTNEGVYINSQIIDEKIILMEDYLEIFEQIKRGLKEIINSNISENLEEFKYNDELEIDLFESKDYILNQSHLEKSSLSINEKINNNNNNNNNINLIKKRNKNNIFKTLDLSDDKIANLILEKRKEIKNKYPESIFKMNIIKDIKINILMQISMEEYYNQYNDKKFMKDIIFSPKYKHFAVSWANEINRKFISISCYA